MGYRTASRKAEVKRVKLKARTRADVAWKKMEKNVDGAWLKMQGGGSAVVRELTFKTIYEKAYLQGAKDSEVKPKFATSEEMGLKEPNRP
jgi:hypothetical protein